ncbi:hypothetical protein [Plasmodium yoelii yoelii]|uniref:Metabolite/drug transporter n=1 Tax=Plasmodium yoelii yoelii TaxID=73239 RepID=Q7RM04_PLAYO|nr:hypothetical protein [Plasmodium yoelii yoelii]
MKKWMEEQKWHINIILMFFHHFFDRINYSMRNTFLHDHYIFLKFKKNKIIGLLSIINSSVCLVISPLIGYYCDKHKKNRLKILRFISISYLLVNIIHYMFIRTNNLNLIILITAISKMLQESSHVITESIFIESIEKGGWLSDISSYRNTFKITTYFYLLSLIIYSPLLWLVPIKETG